MLESISGNDGWAALPVDLTENGCYVISKMQIYRWYVASLIQNFTRKIPIYNVYALDQNLIVVGSSSLWIMSKWHKSLRYQTFIETHRCRYKYIWMSIEMFLTLLQLYIEFTSVRILVCSALWQRGSKCHMIAEGRAHRLHRPPRPPRPPRQLGIDDKKLIPNDNAVMHTNICVDIYRVFNPEMSGGPGGPVQPESCQIFM